MYCLFGVRLFLDVQCCFQQPWLNRGSQLLIVESTGVYNETNDFQQENWQQLSIKIEHTSLQAGVKLTNSEMTGSNYC